MGFFRRHESSPAVAEYDELLEELAVSPDDPDDLLAQIQAAASTAGLHSHALQRRNEQAFNRYADRVLRDDVLSTHQYVMLGTVAEELGVAQPREVERRALIAAYNGGLLAPHSDTHVLTHAGEEVYFETQAALMKEVVLREFRAGYGGVSVRVAKGVRISTGRARGHTVVTGTKIQAEDEGILAVTSRRTVFLGNRKTLEFAHGKLLNLTVFSDGLQFHVSGRTGAPLFTGFDGEVVAACLNQAAQRTLAREAVGEDDQVVLAGIGEEFERRFQAQMAGGPPLDFEAFVAAESARTGRAPEVVRDFVGQLAERRVAELQAELDDDAGPLP